MTNTRIYAVAGAKGGVGKTTTNINLATSIATRGASTVVVELDLAMANLVDFLDLDTGLDAGPTIHDVLAGEAGVPAAIREGPGGIDVLPSGVDLDGFATADIERLPAVLETLLERYDRIALDTGAGLSRETVVPLGLADEAILVSTPRVAAVRDVEKTKQLAERVETEVGGIVFTKSGSGSAPPPPELADFLDVELLGHVPEDPAVPASQDTGTPVVTNASESPAATAYRRIATMLDKRAVRADSPENRTLEAPTIGVVGDRSAAEGAAVETGDATTADGTESDERDEWRPTDDDGGPETMRAATSAGIEGRDRETRPATHTGGDGTEAGANGNRAATDAETERVASDTVGSTEPAMADGKGRERDGRDGGNDGNSGKRGDDSDDAGGSIRDRAKSLFGL